jgi:hypothetical protein
MRANEDLAGASVDAGLSYFLLHKQELFRLNEWMTLIGSHRCNNAIKIEAAGKNIRIKVYGIITRLSMLMLMQNRFYLTTDNITYR